MSSIDSILSKEGKDFVRNVAESVGYSQSKIADIFKNDKGYFFDYEQELCIRICESDNCNIVFDEGFLSDDCTVLCSEKCCYDSISDLVDEDFGDYVYFTNWYEERVLI